MKLEDATPGVIFRIVARNGTVDLPVYRLTDRKRDTFFCGQKIPQRAAIREDVKTHGVTWVGTSIEIQIEDNSILLQ